ncbi:MAG: Cell division protein ftsA [Parcubacteria group bacterium Gr01-1014_44]|nr:MAG: Cell division protein ftsA [Parcubacteria group bacterium Gr01-1014_44]
MARQNIVTGIDVGNSFVKTVIVELNRESLRPRVLGTGVVGSHGLRRGVVIDMDETMRDIGESVKRAENSAGAKVHRAYVSVNGPHIKSQFSRGVIAVSRADAEVSAHDIERAIDAASIVSLPANREIIHVIPKNYLVDGQEHVKNPLGMKGVRLEAEVLIIDGLSPYLRNLAKCFSANDIEVAEMIFAPLASSYAALDKNQKEHGVLSLDLGGGLSTLSFFHEGELVFSSVIPIGSRHITNDLAVALRTSMDVAEEVKLQYGFAGVALAVQKNNKKDEIDLSDLLEEENFIIPRKNIARVVEARVSEVFDVMQNEMKKIPTARLVPAGVVLTGGAAKLPGLSIFVKERLKLPVRIGHSFPLEGNDNYFSDPSLAVAAGLAIYGIEKEFSKMKTSDGVDFGKNFEPFRKLVSWLKNFLP